eukprot:CAMPEP_0117598610 /NCGR_PEP_ID=MMETSP0784-20121206/75494_1 /TAXON_ID=39447 /ORGANISM="" /LENGTH=257 /DNA_ID=CAMNT_0005401083 /DNA_START=1043 /DNA_END=1818 /DNA_ORIENTATION=-
MTVNVVKMTFRGWLSALSGLFMQQELLLTRLAPWLIIANPGSIDSRVCQSSGDVRLLHVRFGGDVLHSGTADTKAAPAPPASVLRCRGPPRLAAIVGGQRKEGIQVSKVSCLASLVRRGETVPEAPEPKIRFLKLVDGVHFGGPQLCEEVLGSWGKREEKVGHHVALRVDVGCLAAHRVGPKRHQNREHVGHYGALRVDLGLRVALLGGLWGHRVALRIALGHRVALVLQVQGIRGREPDSRVGQDLGQCSSAAVRL